MLKRNTLAALVAEFLGTGLLTLVILSIQRSQLGLPLFVALAAGLALVALTLVFGRASVAHFNPAITIAFWTARRIKTLRALAFVVLQVFGAWCAFELYNYFAQSKVQEINLAFNGHIMVAEAIGALFLALACAAAAYHLFDNSRAAIASGVGLALAIIIASIPDNIGLANPAVALGAHAWKLYGSQGWLNFVAGPVLGAVIGVNLYGLLFANPDAPFAFFKRKPAAAAVSSRSTVVSNDYDDDDDEEVDADKAVNENAKAGKNRVAPRSAVTVSKSKKSTAKKVASKRAAPKKKR